MNLTAKQQLRRNVDNGGYAAPTKTYSIPATSNEDGTLNVPAQPVYGIDPNHEPIDMYMAVRTISGGLTETVGAATTIAGSAFFGRAGFRMELLQVTADMTASATVGNRVLQCRITSGTGQQLWIGSASTAVTAGQVCGYDIGFGAPINTPSTTVRRNLANTANTNVQVRESSSMKWLKAGDSIAFADSAAIDAADTITVFVTYILYPL